MDFMEWSIFRVIRTRRDLTDIRIAQIFNNGSNAIFIDKNDGHVWYAKLNPECTLSLSLIAGFYGHEIDCINIDDANRPLLLIRKKGKVFELKEEQDGKLSISCIVDMIQPIKTVCVLDDDSKIVLTADGKVFEDRNMMNHLNEIIWIDNLDGERSFCLEKNGRIYFWKKGQTPRPLLNCPDRVVKAVLGEEHGMILTECGSVHCWGRNSQGQLGNGKINYTDTTPMREVDRPEGTNVKFVDIATHRESYTSVALSIDFKVYVWGLSGNQRLLVPTLIELPDMMSVFSLLEKPQKRSLNNLISDIDEEDIFHDSLTDEGDIKIETRDSCLTVHKLILLQRSCYFHALIGFDETHSKAIDFRRFSSESVNLLIRYFYTRKIELEKVCTVDVLCEFMHLVSEIDHRFLINLGITILMTKLNTENSCLLYQTSQKLKLIELTNFVKRFIIINLTDVLRTKGFMTMVEKDRFLMSIVKI